MRLFDGSALISCRMYEGGSAVWNGFTRNAYEGLGSPAALITMTLLQTVLFLLPFVFLSIALQQAINGRFPGWGWLCTLQVGMILLIRILQARRFGHMGSVWLHPLSIVLLVAVQWASFWKTVRRSPMRWKGRTYNASSLFILEPDQRQSIEDDAK